jgi:hypothetical protein
LNFNDDVGLEENDEYEANLSVDGIQISGVDLLINPKKRLRSSVGEADAINAPKLAKNATSSRSSSLPVPSDLTDSSAPNFENDFQYEINKSRIQEQQDIEEMVNKSLALYSDKVNFIRSKNAIKNFNAGTNRHRVNMMDVFYNNASFYKVSEAYKIELSNSVPIIIDGAVTFIDEISRFESFKCFLAKNKPDFEIDEDVRIFRAKVSFLYLNMFKSKPPKYNQKRIRFKN